VTMHKKFLGQNNIYTIQRTCKTNHAMIICFFTSNKSQAQQLFFSQRSNKLIITNRKKK